MTRSYRWLLIGDDHQPDPHPRTDASSPSPDGEEGHLFVRGHESIRILIRPLTKTMHIFGPGRVQKVHEFSSLPELQEFLKSYEQGVLACGWTSLEVHDRRIASRS